MSNWKTLAARLSTLLLVVVLVWAGLTLAQRAGYLTSVPNVSLPMPAIPTSMLTSDGNKKNRKAYLTTNDPSVKVDDLGPRKFKVIDIHEHVLNEVEAVRLLEAMDKLGVQRTCLMGTTTYTFTLNNKYGFEGFKENNEEIIRLKKKWPDRFCAFVTIDPAEPGNLERLKDYVARGADGIKLYLGHGAATGKGPFHVMPIDDPRMLEIYAWAEEIQLPILMHVNLIKYWDETLNVLEKHPYLRLCLPHFGLHKNTEARLRRLAFLLRRYPNVYTDMSYGYYTFHVEGFEAFAKWRTKSRAYHTEYADKILFASDMVLEPTKDLPYIENTLRSYMQFLESDFFRLFLVPGKLMHGMKQSDEALKKIYETAPARFLLLDENGALPDRSKGWPIEGIAVPPRPPIPPLTPDMIPPKVLKPSSNEDAESALEKASAEEDAAEGSGAGEDEAGGLWGADDDEGEDEHAGCRH